MKPWDLGHGAVNLGIYPGEREAMPVEFKEMEMSSIWTSSHTAEKETLEEETQCVREIMAEKRWEERDGFASQNYHT